MRRLWVQLTLAFGLVTLTGVLVVALLANWRTSADFRGFLAQSQVQESGLPARLETYYAANRSWAGVVEVFSSARGSGAMHGGGQGWMGGGQGMMRGASTIVLADAAGAVVYASKEGAAARLQPWERSAALPLAAGGTTVGYLLVSSPGNAALPQAAQLFLAQVNQALLQAGLAAGLLGLLLGLLIARGLAAPLGRLAAAARQIAQGDLAQRVPLAGPAELADVAHSFNDMADSLARGEQQRRQMVADISHELRTPLTVIQGNLRAMLDDVYPLAKAEVATIYDETLLLRRLVDDLRELALAEAGQLSMRPRPAAVADLLAQSIAVFAAPAAEKSVTLERVCADELPPVQADPDRTGQVLRNLLANALRHTPAGGTITLRARVEQPQPRRGAAPTPMVLFEIIDTGPGLAPDELDLVFARFWRADRSRSRAQGGSGLGLAIARQLVEAQGGQIGVASTPGQGARFWFTLPASAG